MLFRSNDTATTEIYTDMHTLSLHDALPISKPAHGKAKVARIGCHAGTLVERQIITI